MIYCFHHKKLYLNDIAQIILTKTVLGEMKLQSMKKVFLYFIISIFIFALLFLVMIGMVSIKPNDAWNKNLMRSYQELENEGAYPTIIHVGEQKWDNWSAAILLNIIAHLNYTEPVKSLVELKWESIPVSDVDSVVYDLCGASLDGNNLDINVNFYTRYWMGNLGFLYVWLFLTSFRALRVVLFILILSLQILILILLGKGDIKNVGGCFVLSTLLAFWNLNGMCLIYGLDIWVSLFSIVAWLLFKDKKWHSDYCFAFFIGAFTMYFCVLSMPLITLGMWIILRTYDELKQKAISKVFFDNLIISCFWVLGYFVLIATRSVLVKVFGHVPTGGSRVLELIGNGGIADRLFMCTLLFLKFIYQNWWAYLFIFLIYIYMIRKKRIQFSKWKNGLPYLFVAMYPFVWEFIFYGHTNH